MKDLKFTLCLFGTEPEEDSADKPVTYTQEEFEKRLQSETDRRVTEALKTAEVNWEKKAEERIKKERLDAEEKAKLTEQERAQREFAEEKEALKKDRADFEKAKLELTVRKTLSKEGLCEDFAPFLMQEDEEASAKHIETFKTAYRQAVEEAVKARLKGDAPKGGSESKPDDAFSILNARYKKQ